MSEILTLLPLEFNRSIQVEARPERLTGEPGSLLLREALERLELVPWLRRRLRDPRNPKLVTHPLAELLRTGLLLLAQGWRDHDDADVLRDDPALRLAVSDRAGTTPLVIRPQEQRRRNHNPQEPDGLASQPTLSRLAAALSTEENRRTLRASLLELTARRMRARNRGHRRRHLTVDVDSLPIEVHGHQPGSEYNGHYHARIYHPLIASLAETGDLIDAQLREGAVHTAQGALDFIMPLLDAMEKKLTVKASVRIDAGFPEENLLSVLEARGTDYVCRIKNNAVLDRMAEPHLRRPVGRPPHEARTFYWETTYQAESWSRPRRAVLILQERPGELFLHHFWLVTSFSSEQMHPEVLCQHYRERGTAEGHMGELMNVLAPALSSSPRPKTHYRGNTPSRRYSSVDSFAVNEVLLLLNALAYDVAHVVRTLLESATRQGWSLRRMRERVLKLPARLLLHARRATLVVAQSAAHVWTMLLLELSSLRYRSP